MGAAAADYDNDGHPDLFVAGVNRNILYHNNGRWRDLKTSRRSRNQEWSVGSGGRMVRLRQRWPARPVGSPLRQMAAFYRSVLRRRVARNLRIYCHPKYFEGLANTLYRNRGDGTFEDVSQRLALRDSPAAE